MKDQKGFSLIELILVIAIIVILAATVGPVLGSFAQRSRSDATAREVVDALRYAQNKAMAVEQDSAFGVYFDTGNNQFHVFRGDDFGDNPAENITFEYPATVQISESFSGSEVDFDKLFGTTSDIGSITITDNVNGTQTIQINTEGAIELQ